MQRLLLIVSILCCLQAPAQKGFLFIKKNGKKVRTYPEGSFIQLKTVGGIVEGYIILLRRDSIYLNGDRRLHYSQVKSILLPQKNSPLSFRNFMYTTLGVAVSTFGMTASEAEPFNRALISSVVLGYSPWVIGLIRKAIPRKQYRIGKKFRLQVFDLRPY
jgi:hypothetical protein